MWIILVVTGRMVRGGREVAPYFLYKHNKIYNAF